MHENYPEKYSTYYMDRTEDILKIFKEKYERQEFREIGNASQQSKTIEIQNAHFIVDKPWIVREPNYKYYEREKNWYLTRVCNVNEMIGKVPDQWQKCADNNGNINSNYGWCIFSKENHNQFTSCRDKILNDNHTREAVMIYTRPSMQSEYNKNGMHDFMCTQYVQYFINERDGKNYLDCIVNIRSNDAVFGFCNDSLWFADVLNWLSEDLKANGLDNEPGIMYWNAGSIHVYERHFKFLQ